MRGRRARFMVRLIGTLSNHTGGIALGAMLVWLALVPTLAGAANEGIVSAQGGKFFLGANEFRFVGTNAYFMLDAATDGSRHHTDEMMKLANALGFTVLRTWAFLDGTKYGAALQPSAGVYNEAAFRELDYVLAKANEHGVRLILTLVNNWQEFGGIPQYLEWCAPGEHKVAFYTKPSCQQLYRGFVSKLLNRQNQENFRYYATDSTIFAWELANEPRCRECDAQVTADHPQVTAKGTVVKTWLQDMARFVKGTAGQMVATGEEGFDCTYYKDQRGIAHASGYTDDNRVDPRIGGNIRLHPWMYDGSEGTCFTGNTEILEIDFASFHLWASTWKVDDDSSVLWIEDHVRIAKAAAPDGERAASSGKLAKPIVFGEFGSDKTDGQRAGLFNKWLSAVEWTRDVGSSSLSYHGNGALVWQIVCKDVCNNYKGRLETVWPPDTQVSTVLRCHAAFANWAGLNQPPEGTVANCP